MKATLAAVPRSTSKPAFCEGVPVSSALRTMMLSPILTVFELTVVVVPLTVRLPVITVSPPTLRLPATPTPPVTFKAPVVVLVEAVALVIEIAVPVVAPRPVTVARVSDSEALTTIVLAVSL